MTTADVALPQCLTVWLHRRDLSVSQFARRVGLDPSTVTLWLHGKRPVPTNRLDALAAALEVTADDLLEGRLPGESPGWLLEPESAETPEDRLAAAGMTPDSMPVRYEAYCLMCGRGVGRDGVLCTTRQVPHTTEPCHWCGGRLFVREVNVWARLRRIVFGKDADRAHGAPRRQAAA